MATNNQESTKQQPTTIELTPNDQNTKTIKQTKTQKNIHSCMHNCKHTCMHAYIYTYMHAHHTRQGQQHKQEHHHQPFSVGQMGCCLVGCKNVVAQLCVECIWGHWPTWCLLVLVVGGMWTGRMNGDESQIDPMVTLFPFLSLSPPPGSQVQGPRTPAMPRNSKIVFPFKRQQVICHTCSETSPLWFP